jgi:hypothetical protein
LLSLLCCLLHSLLLNNATLQHNTTHM